MPTAAPVSPIKAASTTIVWGTNPAGTAIAPVVSSQIAESIKITPHNGGPVTRITNGSIVEYFTNGILCAYH